MEQIKQWFRRAVGGEPVAEPPPGAVSDDDPDRETSTNAQVAGAVDQPWPGTTQED